MFLPVMINYWTLLFSTLQEIDNYLCEYMVFFLELFHNVKVVKAVKKSEMDILEPKSSETL